MATASLTKANAALCSQVFAKSSPGAAAPDFADLEDRGDFAVLEDRRGAAIAHRAVFVADLAMATSEGRGLPTKASHCDDRRPSRQLATEKARATGTMRSSSLTPAPVAGEIFPPARRCYKVRDMADPRR